MLLPIIGAFLLEVHVNVLDSIVVELVQSTSVELDRVVADEFFFDGQKL